MGLVDRGLFGSLNFAGNTHSLITHQTESRKSGCHLTLPFSWRSILRHPRRLPTDVLSSSTRHSRSQTGQQLGTRTWIVEYLPKTVVKKCNYAINHRRNQLQRYFSSDGSKFRTLQHVVRWRCRTKVKALASVAENRSIRSVRPHISTIQDRRSVESADSPTNENGRSAPGLLHRTGGSQISTQIPGTPG